jgi:Subtilase family
MIVDAQRLHPAASGGVRQAMSRYLRQGAWPVAIVLAGLLVWGPAATAKPAGTTEAAPRLLPGDAQAAGANRTDSDSWLVGGTPDRRSHRIAARFGAQQLGKHSGTYRVGLARARSFVAALRAAGRYQFSEPNWRARSSAFPLDPLSGSQWGLGAIGALSLTPSPVSPSSPLLGILEGTIFDHLDTQGIGLFGPAAQTVSDADALHGTEVASIAAAPANGTGMVGVWPGARTAVFSSSPFCADKVDSIYDAVEAGARVLNMSYGYPGGGCFAHYVATQQAFGAGVVSVAAAGNEFAEGNPADDRPATDPHVITVAALDPDMSSSFFSNANLSVDLSAPGSGILAAVPPIYDDDGNPDGYRAVAGTSYAAPIVAAGTAWVAQARPDLDQTQLTDLVRVSTHDLGPSGYDRNFGFGVFDLPTALGARAPSRDPLEPNDNVSWINGRYFGRPDPPVWRGSRRGVYLDARIDRLEDPFDVYRVVVPGRRAMKVSVKARYGNPTLEIYNGWVKTIISNRGRIDVSGRPGRARETLVISNPFRHRRVAYLSVWPVSLDARYQLTVDRARFR